MGASNRSRIFGGLFLILIGGFLFALRLVPGMQTWLDVFADWPMILILVAVLMLVFGLLVNAPGMAVPACIVGGIGGILLYQNNTQDWGSWSYMWALIPGFVGLGVILSAIVEGRLRHEISGGLWLIFISAVLFITFSALLGGITVFGNYWPVLIILLGVWIIARNIIRRSG